MKRMVLFGAIALILFVMPACAPSQPAGDESPAPSEMPPIKIKYDTYQIPEARDSVVQVWYLEKIKEAAAELGYTIEIEYYWSNALSPTGYQLQSLRDGRAEAADVPQGYVPSLLPLSQGLDQTYVSSMTDSWSRAVSDVYENHYPLRYEWEVKNNAKMISYASAGVVTMFASEGLPTIDDLKGKKIRAYGVTGTSLELLGAVPVGIAFGETYEAMERGVIDAIYGSPFGTGANMGFHEVAPVVIDTGGGHFGSFAFVMSLEFFNNLPEEIQGIIMDLRQDYVEYAINYNREDTLAGIEKLHAGGAKFLKWDSAEVEKARGIVQPAQAQIWADSVAAQGFNGMEMFDMLVKTVAKYAPQSTWESPWDLWREMYPQDEWKP